jgi:hypothetical protein
MKCKVLSILLEISKKAKMEYNSSSSLSNDNFQIWQLGATKNHICLSECQVTLDCDYNFYPKSSSQIHSETILD